MKKITSMLFGSVLLLLTACGGSGFDTNGEYNDNNSPPVLETLSQKALGIIKNYAKSGGVSLAPTLQDYIEAGVSGVTADKLDQVNAIIKSYDKNDVNSAAKIEAILKEQGVGIVESDPESLNTPDTMKPVITLLGDSIINLTVGENYTEAGAIASDDKDGNITNNIIKSGTVDTTRAGTYTVKYNVYDAAGNRAQEKVRKIVVTVSPEEVAVSQIALYAKNNNLTPTMKIYEQANISGVTNDNIDTINSLVEELTYENIDTKSEIQALVDRVLYNTYYVALDGSDSNEGSKQSPWRSVRYAVSQLNAGDILLIRQGLYREKPIRISKGGTLERPILIKSYHNEKAVITTMIDASSPSEWSKINGNIYKWNKAVTGLTYKHISVKGIPLTLKMKSGVFTGGLPEDITGLGQWVRNKTTGELWVSSPDGMNPGTQNIEVSNAYYTFGITEEANHIIIDNITVEGSYYPIEVRGDFIVIKNSTFRNCFGDGIKVAGWLEWMLEKDGIQEWNSQHGKIINNEIFNFGEQGIDITGGDYWLIKGNNIHHGIPNRKDPKSQKNSGIIMKNNSIGNLVTGNRIHDFHTIYGAVTLGGSSWGSTRVEGENLRFNKNEVYNLTGGFIASFMACKNCSMEENYIHDNNTILGRRKALIEIRRHDNPNIRSTGVQILRNRFENNITKFKYIEPYYFDGDDEVGAVIDYNTGDIQSYFDGEIMSFEEVKNNKKYDLHKLN